MLRLLAERSVDAEVSPGMTETIDISPSGITTKSLYLKIHIGQISIFRFSLNFDFIYWQFVHNAKNFETLEGGTLWLAKTGFSALARILVNLLGAKQII